MLRGSAVPAVYRARCQPFDGTPNSQCSAGSSMTTPCPCGPGSPPPSFGDAVLVLAARLALRGRFHPIFHPGIGCSVVFFGSRQEMVFSPVSRRAMRSVMAMWMTASERVGRVS